MKSIYLSVVIPLYNEDRRLSNLPLVNNFLKSYKKKFELILVNDGSTDNTYRRIKKFQKENKNVKIISCPKNQGKGSAVKAGMLKARGKYRLFIDIDLSTPIEEFIIFEKYLNRYDVITASRRQPGAKLVIHQRWIRETMGKVFTKLSRVVLHLPISDFTCGLKCFSAKTAEEIFRRSKINRWGFDCEIFFLANFLHYKVKEVPVEWKDDSATKVRFPQDIIQSFVELLAIRLNQILGRYKNGRQKSSSS